MKYQYVGVKRDKTSRIILSGLRSKGHAFVSAVGSVSNLRCFSNPDGFISIEIQDSQGNPIPEYEGHNMLKVIE